MSHDTDSHPASPLPNTGALKGRTILMSGGSRGIGLAIALKAARDGANLVLLAKTDKPHPALPGTVHTAAAEIEEVGGKALAIVGDVRNDDDVTAAVEQAVKTFGGIDIVVNNASAIDLSDTSHVSMKRYDLMQDINARGTFLLSKTALPHLRESTAGHILTLSPPLNLDPRWAGDHLAYTMAKYGMSLTTRGLAHELRADGIGVNSLWPATVIQTAAIANLPGGAPMLAGARTPEVMADAAYAILSRDPSSYSGHFAIAEDVLGEEGITDLDPYAVGDPSLPRIADAFLDDAPSFVRRPAE
jgi:citronellol/citronellal dehydrogenase